MGHGQNLWPVARSRTENTRKMQKNALKKAIKKLSKIKIENVSRYRPKDTIFKTLCSYAKNYVHEVKNSIKSSKIVKNGPQIVKNKNFQKKFFFAFFYVIMSLHAKNCACRSNRVACGHYK